MTVLGVLYLFTFVWEAQGINDYPMCLSWTFKGEALELSCSSDKPIFTFMDPLGLDAGSCHSSVCICNAKNCTINSPAWDGSTWVTVLTVQVQYGVTGEWICVVPSNDQINMTDRVKVPPFTDNLPTVYIGIPRKVSNDQPFIVECKANRTPNQPTAFILENTNTYTNITYGSNGCLSTKHGSVCAEIDDCFCLEDENYFAVKSIISKWGLQIFKCQMEFKSIGIVDSICAPVTSFSESVIYIAHSNCIHSTTVNILCEVKFFGYKEEPEFGFLPWKHEVNGQFVRYIEGNLTRNTSKIELTSCNLQDYGDYSCRIWIKPQNIKGTSTSYVKSEKRKITVTGPPTCITGEQYLTTDSVVLLCNIYSIPNIMDIKFSKYNTNIEESEKFKLVFSNNSFLMKSYGFPVQVDGYTSQLTIHDVNHQDSGIYRIVVANVFGHCTFMFNIFDTFVYEPTAARNEKDTIESVTVDYSTTDRDYVGEKMDLYIGITGYALLICMAPLMCYIVYTYRQRKVKVLVENSSINESHLGELVQMQSLPHQYETIDENEMIKEEVLANMEQESTSIYNESEFSECSKQSDYEEVNERKTVICVHKSEDLIAATDSSKSIELHVAFIEDIAGNKSYENDSDDSPIEDTTPDYLYNYNTLPKGHSSIPTYEGLVSRYDICVEKCDLINQRSNSF